MRHIKYKATLEGTGVSVQIVEQTHRGSYFGGVFGTIFAAKDGFELASLGFPELSIHNRVYLRGNITEFDNDPIHMNMNFYNRFKQAVIEYNEHYKGGG